jgi:hypothetical protein
MKSSFHSRNLATIFFTASLAELNSTANPQLSLLINWIQVTLRLTVSQSVSLGVEPHLGLMTRYILLFDNYGLAFVGRPL